MKSKINKITEKMKEHPVVTGVTSGSFITILGSILKLFENNEINFSQIMEWILKLKSLIQSCLSNNVTVIMLTAIIITCVVCIYRYNCKKLDNKKIQQQNLLNVIDNAIEKDPTINEIIIEDEKNEKSSASIKRNNRRYYSSKMNNKEIIKFPQSKAKGE